MLSMFQHTTKGERFDDVQEQANQPMEEDEMEEVVVVFEAFSPS